MTYSIGFRAPSTRDLVSFFGDHVASTVAKGGNFYADPDLRKQENPGEVIVRTSVVPPSEIQNKNDWILEQN